MAAQSGIPICFIEFQYFCALDHRCGNVCSRISICLSAADMSLANLLHTYIVAFFKDVYVEGLKILTFIYVVIACHGRSYQECNYFQWNSKGPDVSLRETKIEFHDPNQ